MKKIILFTAIISGLFFTSCQKDEEIVPVIPQSKVKSEQPSIQEQVIGIWQMDSVREIDENGLIKVRETISRNLLYTIKEDSIVWEDFFTSIQQNLNYLFWTETYTFKVDENGKIISEIEWTYVTIENGIMIITHENGSLVFFHRVSEEEYSKYNKEI